MYSEENGRPPIDPVVLFNIVMIQYTFGIRSMRQTIKEIEVNMAYRWFLGYDMIEPIPHFTTFGKNYTRRYAGSGIFERIFERILVEAVKSGFVDASTVFIDATQIKASANKKKSNQRSSADRGETLSKRADGGDTSRPSNTWQEAVER